MARSKTEIKQEITNSFMTNEIVILKYGFEEETEFESYFSNVSIENLLFEFIAYAIFILELIFDNHKKEIDTKLSNQKAGTLSWYRTMALRFQYGFNLVPDRDYFDNTGATVAQIEASKVVKYSAVEEAQESSRVIIKIAGETGENLSPLPEEQKEAFDAYCKEFAFAGVAFTVINYLPDRLFLHLQIKRDALILNDSGMSILNGNYPVIETIKQYMKELPFNGEFRHNNLIARLRNVEGVLDASILSAQSAWINPETNGYGALQPIFISSIPVSGYYEVIDFNNIFYVV